MRTKCLGLCVATLFTIGALPAGANAQNPERITEHRIRISDVPSVRSRADHDFQQRAWERQNELRAEILLRTWEAQERTRDRQERLRERERDRLEEARERQEEMRERQQELREREWEMRERKLERTRELQERQRERTRELRERAMRDAEERRREAQLRAARVRWH